MRVFSHIDNQPTGNYAYDAIGNLTEDNNESISAIGWLNNGKVRRISRTPNSPQSHLFFGYTDDGNGR